MRQSTHPPTLMSPVRQSPVRIGQVIDRQLKQAAATDQHLKNLLRRQIPDGLVEEIAFIRVERQIARITVSNAAVASRLRFMSRTIMALLAPTCGPLRHVSMHVLPTNRLPVRARQSQRQAPRASGHTTSRIRQVARSLAPTPSAPDQQQDEQENDNDKLSAALMRLADNLEKD